MSTIFTNEGIRRLVFGQGAAARLGEELTLLGAKQALVVIDPALAGAEAVGPALESLRAAGVSHHQPRPGHRQRGT
jgi:alcohol dehydrogenase class IV